MVAAPQPPLPASVDLTAEVAAGGAHGGGAAAVSELCKHVSAEALHSAGIGTVDEACGAEARDSGAETCTAAHAVATAPPRDAVPAAVDDADASAVATPAAAADKQCGSRRLGRSDSDKV